MSGYRSTPTSRKEKKEKKDPRKRSKYIGVCFFSAMPSSEDVLFEFSASLPPRLAASPGRKGRHWTDDELFESQVVSKLLNLIPVRFHCPTLLGRSAKDCAFDAAVLDGTALNLLASSPIIDTIMDARKRTNGCIVVHGPSSAERFRCIFGSSQHIGLALGLAQALVEQDTSDTIFGNGNRLGGGLRSPPPAFISHQRTVEMHEIRIKARVCCYGKMCDLLSGIPSTDGTLVVRSSEDAISAIDLISEYFTRLSSQFAFPCVHLLLTFVIPSFDFPNVFNSITLLDLESPQTIRNRKKMAHLLPLASQHNLTVNSVFQGVHDLALGINAGSVWRRSDLMRELRFVLSVKSNVSMIGCVSPQDNTPEEIHKLLTSAAYMIESQC
eukprot:TRINITY_DN1516_c0_g1_i2.p1 TRINITY_DN1516_c0_g1~~TRINITY_DN1516_c0_g1_i2.p1  ORF type:complete len:383 (-),score=94.55 TRINITY_DN1516_c0_g1_i2:1022-2170(-)